MSTEFEQSTPWSWRWRTWSKGERRALWWFLVVPTTLFVLPALLNHPAIDADNLIQNFPLRVLVGRQLDSGHLPLLDPYANAGTPLLAGMNAGAFYPLTLLFAIVPAIGAWLINMIAVYFVSALGTFALGRWHGLSTRASVIAALSYTYSGALVGQAVHLGVVQGFSLLPWTLWLLLSLARRLRDPLPVGYRAQWRALSPWLVSGSGLYALVFLTGEPRAIAEVELLSIVVVLAVVLLPSSYRLVNWRARGLYAATLAVSLVWSVAIAAIQLLPALSFIRFSERSVITYSFFGAGSLAPRWSILFGLPDVFGSNGALGVSGYFATYSLPEVTGYAGILALCAGASFLVQRTRRGWQDGERDFVLYLVVAVVGLFAAWGNYTVVGHLFRAIPLFGSTRLQSRNTVLVDLGLSMLLGWWINRLEHRPTRRLRLGALAPPIVVGLFAIVMMVAGPWLVRHLGVARAQSALANGLTLAMVVHLLIALAVIALLLLGARVARLVPLLAVLLVVDLVTFAMFDATGLVGNGAPTEPNRAYASGVLTSQGRFALVDPSGAQTTLYRRLGEPNMNVFTGLASAQGYGALVSNFYDASTGTHPESGLSACHLGQGKFVQLRLNSLVLASSLLMGLRPNRDARDCLTVPATTSSSRYFGEVLDVASVELTTSATATSSSVESIRFVDATGRPIGVTYLVAGSGAQQLTLPAPRRAAGMLVRSSQPTRLVRVGVTTPSGTHYYLDSDFALAVSSAKWRLSSTMGDVQVFRPTHLLPPAWLVHPNHGGAVTSVRTSQWGDAWVNVHTSHPRVLERSEAYLPGWRATAHNVKSGANLELKVERAGLIQRVLVPTGTWRIHFHYDAPNVEEGLGVSFVGVVAFVGALYLIWRRRRFDKVSS